MIHFAFSEQDTRYLFLKFDNKEDEKWLKKLKEHINLVDPICYLPTYTGIPFTQDFIWEYVQPTGSKIYYCSIGLWKVIFDFFKENNVQYDGLIENQQFFKRELKHTFEEFKAIVDSWGLSIPPRPYQYEAPYKILQWYSSTSQLATRAGKTLIAYIIFRYAMEYLGVKNILMIVPATDLVKQAYNDFNEYAEFFKTECIWSQGKLVESSNLTVGTFQSLIKFIEKPKKGKENKKYNPHFFDKFDCVFVDETHRATANQIKTIISQPFMKNVKLKFGLTGTLPKKDTIDYFCVNSLLGAKIQEIKPKELMDDGYISNIEINQIRLFYQDEQKQKDLFIKCAEYAISEYVTEKNEKGRNLRIPLENPEHQIQYVKQLPYMVQEAKEKIFLDDKVIGHYKKAQWNYIKYLRKHISLDTSTNSLVIERMMTHFFDERVDYLLYNILPKCDKNTLILGHHTQYLRDLYNTIKEKFPDRNVEIITGSVSPKKRDKIKQLLKENNNCILVGSYGCMSTGITLSNLCYGVLFESFKSNVINMQSIGRGLGLKDLSDKYVLYDFIDCFSPMVTPKKIYLQGLAKIKIYDEECYPYKITNINI